MNHKILILFLIFFSLQRTGAQRYTFQKIGLEEGIPSARVNDFLEDSRGFFWIATEGAGLVRFDGFEFKSIDPKEENIKPIVTALAEDPSGNIWFASESVLVSYDGLNFKFYFLPDRQERIVSIVAAEDQMLVAGRRGAYSLGSGDTLIALQTPVNAGINDIALGRDGILLASDSGLFLGNQKIRSGKWNKLLTDGGEVYAQGRNTFWAKGESIKRNLRGSNFCVRGNMALALRRDSLLLVEGGKERILTPENGLPEQDFKGCYIDRAGVVWLYSNTGLSKLPSTAVRLHDGIDDEVLSVLEHNGKYFAGTRTGLYVVEDEKEKELIGAEFRYGVILSIAYYRGNYWLGTERGLVRYDGRSFHQVLLDQNHEGYIFALHANKDGLWIGTGSGIYHYANGRLSNISEREDLPMASIYAISEGFDGSLWFATYIQGFIRKSGNQWENVLQVGQMRLDSLRFNTFAAVSANGLWVGSLSEGLFRVDRRGVENIAPANINFAEPRSMTLDSAGNLWMGTNKGIFKVYPTEAGYRPRLINQTSGLSSDGFTPQALAIADGMLLAGTPDGLLTIDLVDLERRRTAPAIALTDLQFFFGDMEGVEQYAEGIAAFTHVPYGFSLPHNLNFLSFTLAGLSGYQPGDLIYRYRIDPQRSWTQAGNRREAVYSNLPPGNYEFQAQVTRPGEPWGEAMVSYPLEIKRPVWQQWWFISLIVLFLASLTYWYVRDRINRANQRLVMEKSLLEMERKALRLQMNPHFIFNALDSISSFIFKKDPKQAVKYLNNFAKLMRLTLESSMEHVHPVETEVSILKNYLELEKLRFQGKLEYRIEVDEEIDYDVGIPPMLIQPHVENAILHGVKPKEGEGRVVIRFILEDELLICEIEDDGIGRERSKGLAKRKDHRSMATEINRGRLALLRKSMGDKVNIEIIDKQNHSGTKVVLRLPAEAI